MPWKRGYWTGAEVAEVVQDRKLRVSGGSKHPSSGPLLTPPTGPAQTLTGGKGARRCSLGAQIRREKRVGIG